LADAGGPGRGDERRRLDGLRRRLRPRARVRRVATWARRRLPRRLPAWTESAAADLAPAADPRGRQHYGRDLATGQLTIEGDQWRIGVRDRVVVAGRVGAPLDVRQSAALLRLRGVRLPADVGDAAGPAVIAQLAMTGVVLHAPGAGTRVAPELADHIGRPLPDARADELEWELRSVAQRRAALRHHGLAGRPPSVTAVLVSHRPHDLIDAIDALARQSYPDLEVVVGLHGVDAPPLGGRPVRMVAIPAHRNLGEALAEATGHAEGALVTKVDDDDRYGPDHVWDLVLARHFSGATLVGKGAEFVYVQPRGITVRRRMGAELYTDTVAGGTILMERGDLAAAGGWQPLPRHVDRDLLDRLLRAGAAVYRTHGFGFVYTRRAAGHTWDPGLGYFLTDPRRTWKGRPPYDEFGPA